MPRGSSRVAEANMDLARYWSCATQQATSLCPECQKQATNLSAEPSGHELLNVLLPGVVPATQGAILHQQQCSVIRWWVHMHVGLESMQAALETFTIVSRMPLSDRNLCFADTFYVNGLSLILGITSWAISAV